MSISSSKTNEMINKELMIKITFQGNYTCSGWEPDFSIVPPFMNGRMMATLYLAKNGHPVDQANLSFQIVR